jgi:hypothetical protein
VRVAGCTEKGDDVSTNGKEQTGVKVKFDGSIITPLAELIVIRGDEVMERPLIYTWKPFLPEGKLVHFGGNSSQAKSPVCVDLAARITAGAAWPDGTANEHGPRSVIMLNIEDDLADTILPRFRIAGGDKSKLHYIKGTKLNSGESGAVELGFSLNRDMQLLVARARSLPDLGLIIVDPITNYLGGLKMNAEGDVRLVLTPLASLAEELRIVVITVGHFNRREKGTDPLHRMLGAAAFSGVARTVCAFGPDPDEEDRFAHVMTVVRAAGGSPLSLRYKTELITEACPDSHTAEIIRVVWRGFSNATPEEAVDPSSPETKSEEAEAAEMIKDFLADPPHRKPAKDCEQLLAARYPTAPDGKVRLNLSRVRKRARVKSRKIPPDKFYSWYLEDKVVYSYPLLDSS